jgi:hypothetical protein
VIGRCDVRFVFEASLFMGFCPGSGLQKKNTILY